MASARPGQAIARGQRLALAMQVRGIGKQDALAFDLGVHPSAISRWKEGGMMSLASAIDLCSRLEISLDWLILGRGAMELVGLASGGTSPRRARDDTRLLAGFHNIQSQSIRSAMLALIESMAAGSSS